MCLCICVWECRRVCCLWRPGDNHGYCSSGAVHFCFGEFCTTHLDQFYSPTQTSLRYTPFPTHLTIKPNVCCLHTWMCSVPANLTGTNPLRKWLSLFCSSVTSSSSPPLCLGFIWLELTQVLWVPMRLASLENNAVLWPSTASDSSGLYPELALNLSRLGSWAQRSPFSVFPVLGLQAMCITSHRLFFFF